MCFLCVLFLVFCCGRELPNKESCIRRCGLVHMLEETHWKHYSYMATVWYPAGLLYFIFICLFLASWVPPFSSGHSPKGGLCGFGSGRPTAFGRNAMMFVGSVLRKGEDGEPIGYLPEYLILTLPSRATSLVGSWLWLQRPWFTEDTSRSVYSSWNPMKSILLSAGGLRPMRSARMMRTLPSQELLGKSESQQVWKSFLGCPGSGPRFYSFRLAVAII